MPADGGGGGLAGQPRNGSASLEKCMAQEERASALATTLLWTQGVYFLITGVWPLISIRTFQWVTGPKTDHLHTGREADHWLVMAVGVLVTSVAITLLTAAIR